MAVLVNGERIETAAIDEEVGRLQPHYEEYVREAGADDEAGEDQLREWATENLIEQVLVRQAARRAPIEVPPAEIDAAYAESGGEPGEADEQAVKADIELSMRINRLLGERAESVAAPTDEEVREFYEAHRDDLMTGEQVRASHIVKHVETEVDRAPAYEAIVDVQMRLAGGEAFEALAGEHSDCPENAGQLGTFGRGQMVPAFEDVVFAMQPGEVSDIFQTEYGYHIAKLNERIPSQPVPLEQVAEEIKEELLRQRRQEVIEAFLDELRGKADIQPAAD